MPYHEDAEKYATQRRKSSKVSSPSPSKPAATETSPIAPGERLFPSSYYADEGDMSRGFLILKPEVKSNQEDETKMDPAITIQDLSRILGPSKQVKMIDVSHQKEAGSWYLAGLAEYFEHNQHRLKYKIVDKTAKTSKSLPARTMSGVPRGNEMLDEKRILNQISLEFTGTPLDAMVQTPRFARDLDWIDHAWPKKRENEKVSSKLPDIAPAGASGRAQALPSNKRQYPAVQKYCLTSVAGA